MIRKWNAIYKASENQNRRSDWKACWWKSARKHSTNRNSIQICVIWYYFSRNAHPNCFKVLFSIWTEMLCLNHSWENLMPARGCELGSGECSNVSKTKDTEQNTPQLGSVSVSGAVHHIYRYLQLCPNVRDHHGIQKLQAITGNLGQPLVWVQSFSAFLWFISGLGSLP